MEETKKHLKKEKSENTENDNELKVGKNDSPDFNGVGVNDGDEDFYEKLSKSQNINGSSDTDLPQAWKNYPDEPVSGATEA